MKDEEKEVKGLREYKFYPYGSDEFNALYTRLYDDDARHGFNRELRVKLAKYIGEAYMNEIPKRYTSQPIAVASDGKLILDGWTRFNAAKIAQVGIWVMIMKDVTANSDAECKRWFRILNEYGGPVQPRFLAAFDTVLTEMANDREVSNYVTVTSEKGHVHLKEDEVPTNYYCGLVASLLKYKAPEAGYRANERFLHDEYGRNPRATMSSARTTANIYRLFTSTYFDYHQVPAMDITLRPHPDDEAFHKEQGENYFADGMVINDGGFYLHEHLKK